MQAIRPGLALHGLVARSQGSGAAAALSAIVAGPERLRPSPPGGSEPSVFGKRKERCGTPLRDTSASAAVVPARHSTLPAPTVASHAACLARAAAPPHPAGSAVRKLTRRVPFDGGVNTTVTSWSAGSTPNPGDVPSHAPGRTLTSTKSPGAA